MLEPVYNGVVLDGLKRLHGLSTHLSEVTPSPLGAPLIPPFVGADSVPLSLQSNTGAGEAPAEHLPDTRPVEQDVLDAVKRVFEREECDPSIAGGQVWPGPRWSTIPHLPDQGGL